MSMQSILSASQSLTRMQSMQSATTKSQGQSNVLKAEIKQDGERVTESKKDEMKKLEEKAAQNAQDLMSGITEINGELKPSEDEKAEGTDSKKEPETDKLELSSNWKERAEAGDKGSAKISVGDPVTYKPEGGKIKVTPMIAQSEPAVSIQE